MISMYATGFRKNTSPALGELTSPIKETEGVLKADAVLKRLDDLILGDPTLEKAINTCASNG